MHNYYLFAQCNILGKKNNIKSGLCKSNGTGKVEILWVGIWKSPFFWGGSGERNITFEKDGRGIIYLYFTRKQDRKSTRMNTSHIQKARMQSSA